MNNNCHVNVFELGVFFYGFRKKHVPTQKINNNFK